MSFAAGLEAGLLLGKKFGGGGDEPQNLKWKRPADWLPMPEPAENEYCILVAFPEYDIGSLSYSLAFQGLSNGSTINIDWGDGQTHSESVTEFNMTIYHTYNSGIKYAVIKVSMSDSTENRFNIIINSGTNVYPLEIYIGKKIAILSSYAPTVIHIKTFGGVPSSVDDKFINLNSSKNAIQCFETTDPWEYVPNSMFEYCYCLLDFDFSAVKEIGKWGLQFCNSFRVIDIPLLVSLGDNSIQYCKNLKKVNIPNCVDIGSGAFSNDFALEEINCPLAESLGSGCCENDYNLKKISPLNNVSTIPAYCFYLCYCLSEISAPNVTLVQAYAFSDNYKLTKISLPACQEIQQYSFRGNYTLVSISAPNCDRVGNYAFEFCYTLSEINFSKSVQYGKSSFQNCYSLQIKNQITIA